MAVAAAFFVAPVAAQPACGPRDEIVQRLSDVYREMRRAAGLAANGSLVEIFAAESESWTLLITQPGGPAYVLVVGEAWQVDSGTPSIPSH